MQHCHPYNVLFKIRKKKIIIELEEKNILSCYESLYKTCNSQSCWIWFDFCIHISDSKSDTLKLETASHT